jgi:peroxiredoxin
MTDLRLVWVLVLMTPFLGCAEPRADPPAAAGGYSVPQRAEDVRPASVGEAAPTAILRTPEGAEFDLAKAYERAPTLLIFYRGGWCPFCSAHLGEIAIIEDELMAMGVELIAASPDRPEKLQESIAGRDLGYQLLSDSDMALTREFGLAFQLDEEEVARYARSGLDIVEASGHDHHMLPVPAVYLIDTGGIIRFAHWDPDYRQRIDRDALVAAVRNVVRGSSPPAAGSGV